MAWAHACSAWIASNFFLVGLTESVTINKQNAECCLKLKRDLDLSYVQETTLPFPHLVMTLTGKYNDGVW